jgi:hypothetical protein
VSAKPSRRRGAIRIEDVFPKGWAERFDPHYPRVGIGYDIATTTNDQSNPSGITVTQQVNNTYFARLMLRFKAADPEIAWALLGFIIEGLRTRDLRARRLCMDATNERYFAVQTRSKFAGRVPVELVVTSENINFRGEEMSVKAYLANLLINTCDDGYLGLPPERFVEVDFRQTVRDRGTFYSDVLPDGGHADCHRSAELALHALVAPGGGKPEAEGARVGSYGAARELRRSAGRLADRVRGGGQRHSI